jgi:hypothetical protein
MEHQQHWKTTDGAANKSANHYLSQHCLHCVNLESSGLKYNCGNYYRPNNPSLEAIYKRMIGPRFLIRYITKTDVSTRINRTIHKLQFTRTDHGIRHVRPKITCSGFKVKISGCQI